MYRQICASLVPLGGLVILIFLNTKLDKDLLSETPCQELQQVQREVWPGPRLQRTYVLIQEKAGPALKDSRIRVMKGEKK